MCTVLWIMIINELHKDARFAQRERVCVIDLRRKFRLFLGMSGKTCRNMSLALQAALPSAATLSCSKQTEVTITFLLFNAITFLNILLISQYFRNTVFS